MICRLAEKSENYVNKTHISVVIFIYKSSKSAAEFILIENHEFSAVIQHKFVISFSSLKKNSMRRHHPLYFVKQPDRFSGKLSYFSTFI
jgi:hypothetical protein